jgi:hypothetical protein
MLDLTFFLTILDSQLQAACWQDMGGDVEEVFGSGQVADGRKQREQTGRAGLINWR